MEPHRNILDIVVEYQAILTQRRSYLYDVTDYGKAKCENFTGRLNELESEFEKRIIQINRKYATSTNGKIPNETQYKRPIA